MLYEQQKMLLWQVFQLQKRYLKLRVIFIDLYSEMDADIVYCRMIKDTISG